MSPDEESRGESITKGEENGIHTNGHQANSQSINGQHDEKMDLKSVTQPRQSQGLEKKKSSSIGNLMQARKASQRPLPTEMGDGTYRNVLQRPTLLQDIKSFGKGDLKTLKDIIAAKLKGETLQDDKTMIMERTIQLVATMPDKSKRQEILTNSFIDKLWNSLDHPPLLYMGEEFKWRQPDGSNNNPLMPKLGAAKTPYSRTCKPGSSNMGALPDPETIYEAVMARDGFKKNPNNVSSILWYWATLVIHDLFWTNRQDPNQNDCSSYLDLSPLYGNDKESCDSIRTFKDGKLKPDTFADKRLIGNPPGVCVLLIMLNRVHNSVVANLAAINEGGRFVKPPPHIDGEAAAAAWKKYDEDLFQTARLITSGLYINITLVDYVRNIINLNRVDTQWTLDPRQEMGIAKGTAKGSESGVGNVVSAEFNLCYRWHSCISEMDEKWIEDFYKELLGENYGDMNLHVLIGAVSKFEKSIPEDPAERTFNGFARGVDGRFNDDELVDAISTAIEQPGGAFGARNVPRIMKPVELLGIIRGRKWNLSGLNEFRKHFGLKPYETFEDINSDPGVADQLRNLYQHPDNVELYPGIVAEEGKTPMVPGVGIAPTYTISRVVLSDAVSLVRGDRHYTTDYHPGYLTQWGYNEVNYDFNVNHGCVFYKLFLRAFPNHFRDNSVYAHYPMVIPDENRQILTNLKRVDKFDFSRPVFVSPRVTITSFGAAEHILSNQEKYKLAWEEGFQRLIGSSGSNFMLSGDDLAHAGLRKNMHDLLYQGDWKTAVRDFYSTIAERLLTNKSYKIAGTTQVDIVRDVGNLAHTHFVSRLFNLPLKCTENPKGIFAEQELYQMLSLIFICLFHDMDPVKRFPLRQQAKEVMEQIAKVVETNVKLSKMLGFRGLFTGSVAKGDFLSQYGVNVIKALAKSGLNAHDITRGQVLPAAAAMVPNQGHAFAQAVDWYLSDQGKQHVPELHRLAVAEVGETNDALLLGYAMEGIRMAGTFGVYRTASVPDIVTEDDGRQVRIEAGDRVFLSLASAARDENRFPEPQVVNPKRHVDAYIHYGGGAHVCLGKEVGEVALVELFRAVFKKKGIRRVPGPLGELKKLMGDDGSCVYMTEDWGGISPFPASMKVAWDE